MVLCFENLVQIAMFLVRGQITLNLRKYPHWIFLLIFVFDVKFLLPKRSLDQKTRIREIG